MGPWRCLLLLLLAAALRAQQQQFMEYVERRLTLLEVRPQFAPLHPTLPRHGAPRPFLSGGGGAGNQLGERWGRAELAWGAVAPTSPGPHTAQHMMAMGALWDRGVREQGCHGSGSIVGAGASRVQEH